MMVTKHFRDLKWRNPHRDISCMDTAYERENPSPKIAENRVQDSSSDDRVNSETSLQASHSRLGPYDR